MNKVVTDSLSSTLVHPNTMKFPMIEGTLNNLKPEGALKVTFMEAISMEKLEYSFQIKVNFFNSSFMI